MFFRAVFLASFFLFSSAHSYAAENACSGLWAWLTGRGAKAQPTKPELTEADRDVVPHGKEVAAKAEQEMGGANLHWTYKEKEGEFAGEWTTAGGLLQLIPKGARDNQIGGFEVPEGGRRRSVDALGELSFYYESIAEGVLFIHNLETEGASKKRDAGKFLLGKAVEKIVADHPNVTEVKIFIGSTVMDGKVLGRWGKSGNLGLQAEAKELAKEFNDNPGEFAGRQWQYQTLAEMGFNKIEVEKSGILERGNDKGTFFLVLSRER
ncbi:hypothetical protein E3A20_24800 [Planctomyces bekefii]|uniref:Uncharacterized protein n=1 Tax=Planctomyces bekefii TaxID=1653850 RepID=A0A5C6M0X8_9PLAN|nr:hypothetical protein E3A20_24800 [Planctomyces bekefii]